MDPQVEVVFDDVDALDADAQWAMSAYFAELDERFPTGFDPGDALIADATSFAPPAGRFVVIRAGGDAIGCGGLQMIGPGVGEIKRMWIAPGWRGRGLAARLLSALEDRSRAIGHRAVRLDTNATLTTAIALYERSGYVAIERYNDNPYAHHWFAKPL